MLEQKQLTLNLRLDDHNTFDNFCIGNNQELINCLRASTESFIYISGPHYSGRSHLLQACCCEANNTGRTCFYLSLQNCHKLTPQILENLETTSLVCLDDIQSISGKFEWEEAIFSNTE